MKSKIIAIFNWVMGKNESGLSALNSNIDNFAIKIGQLKMAIALLILGALGVGVITKRVKPSSLGGGYKRYFFWV